MPDQINTDCEMIFVDLKLVDHHRPPWKTDDYMEEVEKMMEQVDPQQKGRIWPGGDFNLPHIDWKDHQSLPPNQNIKISNILLNVTNDFSLVQVTQLPTRIDNILDLFFTSNPSLINRVTTPPETDHNIAFIKFYLPPVIEKRREVLFWDPSPYPPSPRMFCLISRLLLMLAF